MGKSTISMAIFNSYVTNYRRVVYSDHDSPISPFPMGWWDCGQAIRTLGTWPLALFDCRHPEKERWLKRHSQAETSWKTAPKAEILMISGVAAVFQDTTMYFHPISSPTPMNEGPERSRSLHKLGSHKKQAKHVGTSSGWVSNKSNDRNLTKGLKFSSRPYFLSRRHSVPLSYYILWSYWVLIVLLKPAVFVNNLAAPNLTAWRR